MVAVGIGELFFHFCRPGIEFAADARAPQLRDHWQKVIRLPLTEVDEEQVGAVYKALRKEVQPTKHIVVAVRPEGDCLFAKQEKH